MTINAEGDRGRESQGEFWILVLAMAGMMAVSMLGLALYWQMVTMFK